MLSFQAEIRIFLSNQKTGNDRMCIEGDFHELLCVSYLKDPLDLDLESHKRIISMTLSHYERYGHRILFSIKFLAR
ncbi:hypothetical protein BH18THE2_BH18THE2_28120 [soil metagenome]